MSRLALRSLVGRSLLMGFVTVAVLAAAPSVADPSTAVDLLAFTHSPALHQGTFDAAGTSWTCGGDLCSTQGPDDAAVWENLCVAFAREAGTVAAFGTVKHRLDAPALARCNESAAVAPAPVATAPAPAPPAPASRAAAPSPAPLVTPAPSPAALQGAAAEPARADVGDEICNGRDDDGDGRIDEGVLLRAWEDRDHDLFGDPHHTQEICPQQLAPGLVTNDYDCDDANPKRNPARDNCG